MLPCSGKIAVGLNTKPLDPTVRDSCRPPLRIRVRCTHKYLKVNITFVRPFSHNFREHIPHEAYIASSGKAPQLAQSTSSKCFFICGTSRIGKITFYFTYSCLVAKFVVGTEETTVARDLTFKRSSAAVISATESWKSLV